MKKLRFLICALLVLTLALPASATTQTDEFDNYLRVQDFIDSGGIYDLGLYSNIDIAITSMCATNPTFYVLFNDPCTQQSLQSLLVEEDDPFICQLITSWLGCYDSGVSVCASYDDYTTYSFNTLAGKTITGLKYIGNSTPPANYPSISNYSSTSKINASSYSSSTPGTR